MNKRIIIFGVGSSYLKSKKYLKDDINIIAFSDNDKNKWNNYIEGKKIIDPLNILNFEYDYIIITSMYDDEIHDQLIELGICKNKIIKFNKWAYIFENYINKNLLRLKKSKEQFDGIITGISYAYYGIEASILKNNFYNLAFGSQDLFYDYKIAKLVIDNYKNLNIKYCIIGLSYYSFQYDLSLSKAFSERKLLQYYEAINDLHNCKDKNNFLEIYKLCKHAKTILFKENISFIDRDIYEKISRLSDVRKKEYLCKKDALLDGNKYYNETVKQNIKILKNYLNFLESKKIKPIIVVVPVPKYYYKYLNCRLENEFNNIIEKFTENYNIQYLNYLRSPLFNDDEFLDTMHLNKKGAIKFSKILNEKIIW